MKVLFLRAENTKKSIFFGIFVKQFHITYRLNGKEEDRAAIAREDESIQNNETALLDRLLDTNDKIARFYHNLIDKDVLDESVIDEIDNIYGQCERQSNDAEHHFNWLMANPNITNLQLEKAAHDKETAINAALDSANTRVLAKINEGNPPLDQEDTAERTAVFVEQLQISMDMNNHNARKAEVNAAKHDFHERYNEDWNHVEYSSEGSLVDDYADPNQEQPSHMDPDD
jgi:hypothetical protein